VIENTRNTPLSTPSSSHLSIYCLQNAKKKIKKIKNHHFHFELSRERDYLKISESNETGRKTRIKRRKKSDPNKKRNK
jgi:hypothetical protein